MPVAEKGNCLETNVLVTDNYSQLDTARKCKSGYSAASWATSTKQPVHIDINKYQLALTTSIFLHYKR
jgi:hypothetical protein